MFDQLFATLGTLESGLADKSLKSTRQIKTLLSSAVNQATTLLQNGGSLPKGARSSLTTARRILSDCLSGMETGNITYKQLRAASRDKIGREHAILRRIDEAARTQSKVTGEFEDDDSEPMAASSVVKAKAKQFEKALSERYVVNKEMGGQSAVMMIRKVGELVEILENKLARESDSLVKKVDVAGLVANHTLAELAELSVQELVSPQSQDSDEVKELVASYANIMGRIPAQLHSPFQAFEFVVVPLFGALQTANGAARTKFLNAMARAGVKVRMIGDHYPVFEKQYLLALDCKRLGIPKSITTTKAGRTKSVNTKGQDNGPDTVVGKVLDTINSVSPVQYVPASTMLIPNPRNPEVKLMWIVPEKVRVAISNSLHTSEVKWGLPADIEA